MDIEVTLNELHYKALLRKAHLGDTKARQEYQALIEDASDDWDNSKYTYLIHLREVVVWELLDEYARLLEGKE